MWLVFKLFISNIHSDSFSIYTYIQSIHFCFDQIPRMVLLWNWTLDTLISLWDWAARLGASTRRLLKRHLLPTQILQKILKQSFQPRQLRDRTKMEGHIVGTGVSVPSPLQAKCFGKAGAWRPQVDRRAKPGRDTAKEGFSVTVAATVRFPQKRCFTVPLKCICPTTDTEQEPADN